MMKLTPDKSTAHCAACDYTTRGWSPDMLRFIVKEHNQKHHLFDILGNRLAAHSWFVNGMRNLPLSPVGGTR